MKIGTLDVVESIYLADVIPADPTNKIYNDGGQLYWNGLAVGAGSGGSYILPKASASTLGGIRVGANLSIDVAGILSAPDPYTLPVATDALLGGIRVGSGLSVDGSGVLSATPYVLPAATAGALGGVRVGARLSIDGSGVLSADEQTYTLPMAAAGTLGGIRVGARLSIDGSGVLSAADQTYTLPTASASILGGVRVGSGLAITSGILSATYTLPTASATVLGGIKVGANLSIDGNGVLSGTSAYVLPVAAAGTLGGVRIGAGLSVDGSGVASVDFSDSALLAGAQTFTGQKTFEQGLAFTDGAPTSTAQALYSVSGALYWNGAAVNTGGGYTLPAASGTVLGGIKVGARLSIDGSGVLSAADQAYVLPAASAGALGGVRVGARLSIDGSGILSADAQTYTLPTATDEVLGGVMVGAGLSITDGVLSSTYSYTLPVASGTVLGGVKIGTGLQMTSDVVSVVYGTTAGTAAAGNDSRLSDSRAPTAHALDGALHTISGKTAGQLLLATAATTFAFTTLSGDATLSGAGALTLASTAVSAGSYGSNSSVSTFTVDDKGRLTAAGSTAIAFPVASVFGRTGAVVATSGDYTTAQVTESGNLYFTEARALSSVLTGYAVGTNTALAATDSVLAAFGKVQAQINARPGTVTSVAMTAAGPLSVSGSPITSSGTLALTWSGTSTDLVRGDGSVVASSSFAAASHVHAIANITNLQTTLDGKEAGLGNPGTNGYLLSSTTAGVRSWVAPYTLPLAAAGTLGGVRVGTGLSIDGSGILSVTAGAPSNMVTTDTTQTVSGAKTLSSVVLTTTADAAGSDIYLSGNSMLAAMRKSRTTGDYSYIGIDLDTHASAGAVLDVYDKTGTTYRGLGLNWQTVSQDAWFDFSTNTAGSQPSRKINAYVNLDFKGGLWITDAAPYSTANALYSLGGVLYWNGAAVATGGGGYTLPPATATTLGGIKVGDGLAIDGSDVLSVTYAYTLPTAAAAVLGGIKVGARLSIDGAGVLSAADQTYTLPIAAAGSLGGIRVGAGLSIDGSGILSTSVTAEPALGNPGTNGYVLASTTAGVRSWVALPVGAVTTVFGRAGAVVATSGDYNTDQVTEGTTNLYYTNSRADARITLQKGAALGLATLGADGKIPLAQLPAAALVDTFTAASEVAMLALSAEQGDVCVRTDIATTFILSAAPASTLANWQQLLSPVDGVTSVGLSAPSIFTVSGSPVTSSGTLSFAWNSTSAFTVLGDGTTSAITAHGKSLIAGADASASRTTLGLTGWATKAYTNGSTTDVAEGTNLYWTSGRFDTAFAAKTTDGLTEGSTNLYFTAARAQAAISATGPVAYSAGVISHATSGVTANSYGSASSTLIATVNATGHITALSASAIAIDASQVNAGTLGVARGGTGLATFAGAYYLPYSTAATTLAALAPNTTTSIRALTMTGTGSAGATPAWVPILTSATGDGVVVPTTTATTGAIAFAHAAFGTASTYGSATQIPEFTTNATGHVIGVTLRAVTAAGIGAEAALGNPGTSGYVLSSTDAGVRSWIAIPSAPVTTVFGRAGAVVATSGDYTTAQVTESGNLYYTDARVRATALTGYAVSTNTALAATDTILEAFGKVQAQVNARLTSNQTITLSGVITGSGTTAITTSIADAALSIAKTNGLQTALNGKEAALGNPGVDGYVLSSTAAGVRSWVVIPSAPVTTVFGRAGAVVATSGDYNTDQVTEGTTNLYYTNSRADARITLQKGAALGLATLDAGGKIPLSQLPATAIVETFTAASEVAMLALSAQQGDVCVRTDISTTFILTATPASTIGNWQQLLSPLDGVTSVGLSAPGIFTVSGSPITASGTLSFAWNSTSAFVVLGDGTTSAVTAHGKALFAGADASASRTTLGLTGWATKAYTNGSTTDVAEGTNLYWTSGRFDTALGTKTTDNLGEGATNLYFTAARAQAAISATGPIAYATGVVSHATSGVTANSYGDAASTLTATVNATGHVTSLAASAIAIAASQVTSGTLGVARGGTGLATFTGAYYLPYSTAATTLAALAPNTSTSIQALTMTGTGAAGAVPTWVSVLTAATGDGIVVPTTTATTGAVAFAHAAFGTANTYGSATQVPVITTNATGHVTGVSLSAITAAGIGAEAALGNPGTSGYVLASTTGGVRSWVALPTGAVTTVFGRAGAVVATAGDYTTAQVTESGNLYFTEARVLATVLTGYASGTNTALAATDTVLAAFGKIQAQINARPGTVTSVAMSATGPLSVAGSPVTSTGTLALTWSGTSADMVRADGSTVAQSTFQTALTNPVTGTGANTRIAYWSGTGTQTSAAGLTFDGTSLLAPSFKATDLAGGGAGLYLPIARDNVGTLTSRTAVQFRTDIGAEAALGNPGVDGYVLSSTAAGVRSWVLMTGGGGVTTVFGRSGAVVATSGDYTTAQVTESGSLYFTEARVCAAVLTGLSTSTNAAVIATDSVLVAFGKLQAHIAAIDYTTQKAVFVASTTSYASANMPSGVAPSSPVSGDLWNASGLIKFYDGAAIRTLAALEGPQAFTSFTTSGCEVVNTSDESYRLLLHFDGTNGSRRFLDAGSYSTQVAASGTNYYTFATHSTTQTKFGGSSLYLNGSTWLEVFSRYSIGTGDFSVDFHAYLTSTSGTQTLFDWGGTASGIVLSYSGGVWTLTVAGTACTFSQTPTANTWYHIAMSRTSNSVRFFVAGTKTGTTQTASGSVTATNTASLLIGANAALANRTSAYIDEFRFLTGVSAYTSDSNITVPTAAYAPHGFRFAKSTNTVLPTGYVLALDSNGLATPQRPPVVRTVTFVLGESITNSSKYFYVSRGLGNTQDDAQRSGNASGMSYANACGPEIAPCNGRIVRAILKLQGAGTNTGTVTYPVAYRCDLYRVGWAAEHDPNINGGSPVTVNFSLTSGVGTYSLGTTNATVVAYNLDIPVNVGDALALKFIAAAGNSTVALSQMAVVTLVIEETF